jgi:hypothetical protein
MLFPAQAFGEAYPRDLPVGSLFRFHEFWHLRVGSENEPGLMLSLEGPYAGQLIQLGQGMAKSVAIMAPFCWFPAIAEGTRASSSSHRTTTLTLTGDGIRIIGGLTDHGDVDYLAYRLDGTLDEHYRDEGIGTRFLNWSAQLAHSERPLVSLGTLFNVSVASK